MCATARGARQARCWAALACAYIPHRAVPLRAARVSMHTKPPCMRPPIKSMHWWAERAAGQATAPVPPPHVLQVGRRTHLGDTTESTDLTELSEFVGPAGSGSPSAQVRQGLPGQRAPAWSSLAQGRHWVAAGVARSRPISLLSLAGRPQCRQPPSGSLP